MAESAMRGGSMTLLASGAGFSRRVGEPAGDLDLILGEEAHPVLARGVQIAVEGVLDPVERKKRHRCCDPDVYPEHPGLHPVPPVPYGGAVFGVDGAGVSEGRAVGELDGLVERLHTDHRKDGAEDLLAADPHLSRHTIEERRTHKEALLPGRLPAVEYDLGPLLLSQVDVGADLVAVGVADDWGELGTFFPSRTDLHRGGGLL